MIRFWHSLVLAVLVPLWGAMLLTIYWLFIEPAPAEVHRVGPFVSRPVGTAEEAEEYKITFAPPLTKVYLYEETCLKKKVSGEIMRAWIGDFHSILPTTGTLGSEPGCFKRSFEVMTPFVAIPTEIGFRKKIVFDTNPLRQDVMKYPDVPFKIVPNEGCQ